MHALDIVLHSRIGGVPVAVKINEFLLTHLLSLLYKFREFGFDFLFMFIQRVNALFEAKRIEPEFLSKFIVKIFCRFITTFDIFACPQEKLLYIGNKL